MLPEGTGPKLALHIAPSLSLALQYDFMERLDGKEKWSVVESPRERRSIQTLVQNEAVFVQYLDVGLWHLAFYNDGKDKEMVSFNTVVLGRFGVLGGNSVKGGVETLGALGGRLSNPDNTCCTLPGLCCSTHLALTAQEFHRNLQGSLLSLRMLGGIRQLGPRTVCRN